MERRIAVATPSGVKPSSTASGGRADRTAAAMRVESASIGRPFTAPLIASRGESGSRKKSPASRKFAITPSASSRSTTTSLPPGTLYSPCMPDSSSRSGMPSAGRTPLAHPLVEPGEEVRDDLLAVRLIEHLVAGLVVHDGLHIPHSGAAHVLLGEPLRAARPAEGVVAADEDEQREVARQARRGAAEQAEGVGQAEQLH